MNIAANSIGRILPTPGQQRPSNGKVRAVRPGRSGQPDPPFSSGLNFWGGVGGNARYSPISRRSRPSRNRLRWNFQSV